MRSKDFNLRAIKIALIYLSIGFIYIIFSSSLVERLVQKPELIVKIEILKGLIFVVTTALIIYLLIRNEFKKHKITSENISEKYIKQLEERNHFIQTVLDNLPIGVALNKIDEGYATYMNRRFIEIYGWPEEDLKNISAFFEKVYPDRTYRDEIKNKIMEDIRSGDPGRMRWNDIRVTQKNGNSRIINAVNIPLIEQNIMVSTVIDVTEQKNIESSLRDSRAFISYILENLPVGIIALDKNFNYILVNKTLLRFSKYSEQDLIGSNIFKVYPGLEGTDLETGIKRSIEGEIIVSDDYPHPEDDNSDRWFYSIFYPNRDADGNITGIIIQVVEITDRKKAEQDLIEQNAKYEALNEELTQMNEELFKAKEKAEQSDKLKTAFLQNMSHEIRTPMNGIVGYADLLKDPSLSTSKRISYTDTIIKSSEQLLSIVTDVITISTIETRQERLNISEINLNDLLLNLKDIFTEDTREKGLKMKIHKELDNRESFIYSDKTKLTQIFTNLISNAIKFTDKGLIEFGYRIDKKIIKFFVKDTGIGIEKDMLEKIFERFRQVDISSAKKYGGTGLGLSISKGLVELLGGKIWVQSIPGDGSVFYFTINYDKVNNK